MPKFIFFFCILLSNSLAICDVDFENGFAVVGGSPQRHLQALYPETLIACDPVCVMKNGATTIQINYSGFGTLEHMLKITEPNTVVDHLLTSLNGKIDFKIGSIVIKEAKKVDILKTKKEKDTEPLIDDPLPDDAKGLVAHEISVIDQLINLQSLYPESKAMVLHHHGGEIFVVPQKLCLDSCQLTVEFNGTSVANKSFKSGQRPFVNFKATESTEGIVHWTFLDGTSETEGAFEVRRYSNTALGVALQDSRSVEILP